MSYCNYVFSHLSHSLNRKLVEGKTYFLFMFLFPQCGTVRGIYGFQEMFK